MGTSFKIAEAFVEFWGKDAPLLKTMEVLKEKLETFTQKAAATFNTLFQGQGAFTSTQILAIFGFGKAVQLAAQAVAVLVSNLREASAWARDLKLLGFMSGTNVEALQRTGLAGAVAGVGAGQAAGAMSGFRQNLREGQLGMGTSAYAAQLIGVSLRGADGRLRELNDILGDVAEALQRFDAFDQDVLGRALFGSGASTMLELIRTMRGNLKDTLKEAALYGTIVSKQLVDSLSELNKPWKIMEEQLAAIWKKLVAIFGPLIEGAIRAVNVILAALSHILGVISEIVTRMPALIGGLLMIGGVAFGSPVAFFAGAAMLVGGLFGGNSEANPDRALGRNQVGVLGSGDMSGGIGLTSFQAYFEGALRAFASVPGGVQERILDELKTQTSIMRMTGPGNPRAGDPPSKQMGYWEALWFNIKTGF